MLFDLWQRLLTPCPRHLRQMGYLRELLGIRRRYAQWREAWEPHCARTRQVILDAAARCPSPGRKAVLFGSGWLYDIPLSQLASRFREVILVDVLHPHASRRLAKQWPNVTLLDGDVTGSLEMIWRAASKMGASLQVAKPGLFLDDPEIDLVVSVNLLSQLPCIPELYLRKWGEHGDRAIADWSRRTVQAHLDYLRQFRSVVSIIADVEVMTLTQAGQRLATEGTLYGVEFPWHGQEWIWPLVPRTTRPPHHAKHLRVIGVPDIRAG